MWPFSPKRQLKPTSAKAKKNPSSLCLFVNHVGWSLTRLKIFDFLKLSTINKLQHTIPDQTVLMKQLLAVLSWREKDFVNSIIQFYFTISNPSGTSTLIETCFYLHVQIGVLLQQATNAKPKTVRNIEVIFRPCQASALVIARARIRRSHRMIIMLTVFRLIATIRIIVIIAILRVIACVRF